MKQFDLAFLQAVNDWQRGGDHKQKLKRGAALKACSLSIEKRFRMCTVSCFRQEAHEKDRVWQLIAENKLDETIAAWTIDLQSALNFKGGVPPPGLQGVIFEIIPPAGSVVLNLVELYRDAAFLEAVESNKAKILGYGDGIGKYGASQNEVVLELGSLAQAQIRQYGGYASARNELAELHFGRPPTVEDLNDFEELCERSNLEPAGSWWLSTEGTSRVLARVLPQIARLKAKKAAASDSA